MFERFTDSARQIVVQAQVQARALQAPKIGTEHLLLSLLAAETGIAGSALRQCNLREADVRADIARLAGPEGSADAEALRAIGIDLDQVRAAVEQAFGLGALERRTECRSGGRRVVGAGHLPFSPRSKKVLELSLREALQLGDNYIGAEHILLGLSREGRGLALQIITARGVVPAELRRQVLVALGKAA